MNPREMRDKYVSSRKKRIYSIILIVLVLLISMVGIYQQAGKNKTNLYEAVVLRVVDGDTIIVALNNQEERIRMIGVDAPESVSLNEEENTVWGQSASEYTKSVLEPGTNIWLTFDIEERDQYGRMLAYIWLDSDTEYLNHLFQKKLIEEGYALAIRYEPNTKYAAELYAAMEGAISTRKGLWAEESFYEEFYQ